MSELQGPVRPAAKVYQLPGTSTVRGQTLLRDACAVYIVAKPARDKARAARLGWWVDRLGDVPLADLDSDAIADLLDGYAAENDRKYLRKTEDGAAFREFGTRSPASVNRPRSALGGRFMAVVSRVHFHRTLLSVRGFGMNEQINHALLQLKRRAEMSDPRVLVKTFVGTGALPAMLHAQDHQVIYGRRGTGKTHALHYLSEKRRTAGDVCAYIDMRVIGSSIGVFADESIPLSERATRLLRDTLSTLHERLLDEATSPSAPLDLSKVGPSLNSLIDSALETEVVGTTIVETQAGEAKRTEEALGTEIAASIETLKLQVAANAKQEQSQSNQQKVQQTGQMRHRVRFGAITQSLEKICASIHPRRVWVLLDEWSTVPLDLQPYLADMIRRCLLPVAGLTVKIAAIEHRTQFLIGETRGTYTGIEVGADMSADLNLDDFMVFDNNAARAVEFFRRLIFNHFDTVQGELGISLRDENAFASAAFTQRNALEEVVRAAEGVPRDAINVLALCAQKAGSSAISVAVSRAAAKTWYQRDKESAVSANPRAAALLRWVVDEVIGHRKARAFLVESGTRNHLIDSLFDSRVLHLLKRNISAPDEPGVRYDVFKIDYGCYVDLLTTDKGPQGLLPSDERDGRYIEVPPDDYRAIRRAILDLTSILFVEQDGKVAVARVSA